jgi:hypothetical protein
VAIGRIEPPYPFSATCRLFFPGKRRSTLCGYLVGCLVLRFQRSSGQIPGYRVRTFPPPRQRIAYRVQALGGFGKALDNQMPESAGTTRTLAAAFSHPNAGAAITLRR